MQTPQELPLKTVQSIKSPHHLSQEVRKPPLKIKSCCPLDYSSNLEFTHPNCKSNFPRSLCNMGPGQQSYTLHKIHHNITNLQTNFTKRSNLPGEQETSQKIDTILKKISSVDNEIELFEIWPGSNRFYFNGRLMTGPETDKLPNSAAWGFFLGFSAVFFGSLVPSENFVCFINFLSIYLFLLTLIFFCLTSFTDPGIIPRKCVWELNGEVPKRYCTTQRKDSLALYCTNNHHSLQVQNLKKFCSICNIYQPRGTVHCKHCGNCVEGFKDHLRIFNNCIGKRNYRFFVGLKISMVLMIFCFLTCFLILMIQSFRDGPEGYTGAGAGLGGRTLDIAVASLVGAPTSIFFLIKFSLFCRYLLFKARKRANQEQNQERKDKQGIHFKGTTADWCYTEPSKVNPRQLISRAQLQKYKVSLIEGQNEV